MFDAWLPVKSGNDWLESTDWHEDAPSLLSTINERSCSEVLRTGGWLLGTLVRPFKCSSAAVSVILKPNKSQAKNKVTHGYRGICVKSIYNDVVTKLMAKQMANSLLVSMRTL